MHEVSLIHALFDQADRAIRPHPASAVREMTARIGALGGVDVGLFRTAFDGCRDERGYACAQLIVVQEAACWKCVECDVTIAVDGALVCPSCLAGLKLTAGDGIFLDKIELEVADV